MDFKQFAKKGKKVLKSATVFMMVVLIGTTTLVQAYATYAQIKIEHVWVDNGDSEGVRPDTIDSTIVKNDTHTGTTEAIETKKPTTLDTSEAQRPADGGSSSENSEYSGEVYIAGDEAETEEMNASSAEASAPSAEASAPSAEASAPSAEASAPSVEASAPSVEASVPSAGASAPSAGASAPSAEASAPSAEPSAPVVESLRVDDSITQDVADAMSLDDSQEVENKLDSALENAIKDLMRNEDGNAAAFEQVLGSQEAAKQFWETASGSESDLAGRGDAVSNGRADPCNYGYLGFIRDENGDKVQYDPEIHGDRPHLKDGTVLAPINYSAELTEDSNKALEDADYSTRLKIEIKVVSGYTTEYKDKDLNSYWDETEYKVFVSYDHGKIWIGENPEDTYDPEKDLLQYTTYTYLHLRPASYGITPDPEEPKPEEPKPEEPKPEEPRPERPTPERPAPERPAPEAEIPSEDVPLAEIPEEDVPLAEIPEENVPLSEIPKTGDHSVLWLCAALASGAALLFVTRRKETV